MANITKVYLLNVPLENDYKNTLYFASKTTQQQYFQSRIIKSYTDFSYQRKDNFIRVPAHYDSLLNCNYVMYQNTAYNNKWFYAFITDMKYIDDGRTDIMIETDCFQTWYFDITVKASFIDREHTDDDTIGANTIPEGLESGEYIANTHQYDTFLNNLGIIIGTSTDFEDKDSSSGGGLYGGIYSGITYYAFPMTANSEFDIDEVNEFIKSFANEGKADQIQCVFMAPDFLYLHNWELSGNIEGKLEYTDTCEEKEIEFDKEYYMNDYAENIKNNKLFTYPYNYLYVSNNAGASVIYKYEYFKDKVKFKVQGVLTPGGSIRMVPKDYKGTTILDEEGINLGKYPICNWSSDVYTNWLTQNSVNIGLQIAAGAGQIIGGAVTAIATGGVGAAIGGGSIMGGVSTIANTLAEVHTKSFTPPQAQGNINCGDVTTSSEKNTFHFYNMSIKKEYIKIIDDFFSMFGYKTNRVKVPNYNHRSRFWYTKTIDVNIDGAIPNNDMQVIKNAFNNGITYWRSASDINNYTAANTIL